MRFTERNNHRLFNIGLLLVFITCQTFVSCQTKEQKVESALKQCRELLDKDDFIEATNCYDAAATANPDKASKIARTGGEAVFDKCLKLFDKGNYEQSLVCIDPEAALKQGDANIHLLLADTFYRHRFAVRAGKTEELSNRAEDSAKRNLEVSPDDAAAHWIYGEILYDKFQSEKAMQEFRQAIKLAPETPDYWMRLADIQENSGSYWEAVTSYNQALLIDSDNVRALYDLGLLYEKMDRIDEAVFSYEKLLRVEPDYEDARQRLEQLKYGFKIKSKMI